MSNRTRPIVVGRKENGMRTTPDSTERKGSPARRPARVIRPFEGDTRDAVIDSILDYSLQALLPFLGDGNHAQDGEVSSPLTLWHIL